MLGELGSGFALGLLATLSPCALPLYPGFLAYLAARGEERGRSSVTPLLGLAVLAGVLTVMLGLGLLIAALRIASGDVIRIVTPLADAVVVALGVLLLFGRNPFVTLPMIGAMDITGGPLRSAYVYGLLYGPIAFPCSGALLVTLFGLSLSLEGSVATLLFFLAFGVGLGVPLFALSLLATSGRVQLLTVLTRHHATITRGAGALLIVVGAAALARDLPFLLDSFAT